jgi:hypothetical protein
MALVNPIICWSRSVTPSSSTYGHHNRALSNGLNQRSRAKSLSRRVSPGLDHTAVPERQP